MREINLIPESYFKRKKQQRKLIFYFFMILLVSFVLVEGYYFVLEKAMHMNAKLKQIELQLKEHESLLHKKGFDNQEAQQLLKQYNVYNKLVKEKVYFSKIFTEIEDLIPKGVQLNSLSFSSDKKMVLKGFATSNLMVAQFIAGLENSMMFENVSLSFISASQQHTGSTVLYFQIVSSITDGGRE